MNRHYRIFSSAAGMALLLCTCAGWGTGEYQGRLDTTVEELRKNSVFGQMTAAASVPGTPLLIRFPPATEAVSVAAVPLASDTDPKRYSPPDTGGGPMLHDHKATYEGFISPSEGATQKSYYCYVVAVDAAQHKGRHPKQMLWSQVKKVFPDTTGQWEMITCDTQSGLTSEWSKMRATGLQDFCTKDAEGKLGFAKFAGTVEIYCAEVNGQWVVICWRVPTELEKHINLTEWGPLVAGAVQVP